MKYLFIALMLFVTGLSQAEDNWIIDEKTKCRFFNKTPQLDETVKFEGVCNSKNAKGKLTWYSGSELTSINEGNWLNGRLQGKGRWENSKGDNYVGDYFNNKRTGKGIYKWVSGSSYEGDFQEGKRTGKGVFKWTNGAVYEGGFVNGKLSGSGVYKSPNGLTHTGEYLDGLRSGKGVLKYSNGTVYSGEFLNGKLHGTGVMTYFNGDKYVGSFADGKFNGRGLITFTKGLSYQGEFVNDLFSGSGTITFEDGKQLAGQFLNGDYVPRGDGSRDDQTCQGFGFTTNTSDYRECRQQIENAKQTARREAIEYQNRIAEQERKDRSFMEGLALLSLAAGVIAPPPPVYSPPSSTQIYTLPGGRSMTCNTMGNYTNCN